MMYNSKGKWECETTLSLVLFAVALPCAAWLLFATTVWPAVRLSVALAYPVGIALPTILYLRLRSETQRLQEKVRVEQLASERLLPILEATPDLVAMSDMEGKICYFNRAGRQMVGLPETGIESTLPLETSPPMFGAFLLRKKNGNRRTTVKRNVSWPVFDATLLPSDSPVADVAEQLFPIGIENGFWQGEKRLRMPDGRVVPVSQVVIAHKGQDGKVAYLSTITRDISKIKEMEEQMQAHLYLIRAQKTELEQHQCELEQHQRELEEANARTARTCLALEAANRTLEALATTDGLTSLNNHRAFQQKLAEEFERAARYHSPLSLLLVDVDNFKQFNDTFGHPAGDEVLMQVAAALQSIARLTDFVARYGGEEFVLVLPETDEQGAVDAAERVRAAIETSQWSKRSITVSIGVASLRLSTTGPARLIEEADQALYVSKEFGRNCVTHHDVLLNALVQSGEETVGCRI